MGRYCRFCGSTRPNEKFSGRGHKIGLCRDCAKLPKEIRQKIEDENFIYGVFLNQSNISKANIATLQIIEQRNTDDISEKAKLIAEIARLFPQKKKRIGMLYHKRKDLFDKLVQFYFIDDFITPGILDEAEYENIIENDSLSYPLYCSENESDLVETFEEDEELPF